MTDKVLCPYCGSEMKIDRQDDGRKQKMRKTVAVILALALLIIRFDMPPPRRDTCRPTGR